MATGDLQSRQRGGAKVPSRVHATRKPAGGQAWLYPQGAQASGVARALGAGGAESLKPSDKANGARKARHGEAVHERLCCWTEALETFVEKGRPGLSRHSCMVHVSASHFSCKRRAFRRMQPLRREANPAHGTPKHRHTKRLRSETLSWHHVMHVTHQGYPLFQAPPPHSAGLLLEWPGTD